MKDFRNLKKDKLTRSLEKQMNEVFPNVKSFVRRCKFDNGFGISVIRHGGSYGGTRGLFEIAVLDKNGGLTYETDVADDVIGFLNAKSVTKLMRQIEKL